MKRLSFPAIISLWNCSAYFAERPLALPAAPSGALQPRHPQRAGAFRLCQESLRAGTSPVPLGYVVPAPVSQESIPRTASPGTAEHPRPSGGGCGAEGGERRLLPALAGGARGAPAPGARARRSPGAPCSAAAAAAMKSLCLVTVGVLAMTLLIASISLLVAHVFQTVVDLQVKQVKALARCRLSLVCWVIPSQNSRGREGAGCLLAAAVSEWAGASLGPEPPLPSTTRLGWDSEWSSDCSGP